MKRIDSVNARPDENGLGKAGFNDNADLPGQDATYVTPGWFNTVQEELCNLLELRGITLDPASKRQLYDLLTTQADLEALADEIETNFIRKNQIANNLTTDDATKVASARTVRDLQDNKLDKAALNNTLTSASTTEALTAAQGKILREQQYGYNQDYVDVKSSRASNVTYTNPTDQVMHVIACFEFGSSILDYAVVHVNGKEILKKDIGGGNGAYSEVSFPIPPRGNYKIDKQNYVNIISWKEFTRV